MLIRLRVVPRMFVPFLQARVRGNLIILQDGTKRNPTKNWFTQFTPVAAWIIKTSLAEMVKN